MEHVARSLIARGHRVSRINLNFGDRLFWRFEANDYRGDLTGWRDYIARFLETRRITHIFFLGDRRPYHKVAAEEARSRGIRVLCTDLGYLRPDWLALAPDATTSLSEMPRNSEAIYATARLFKEPDFNVRSSAPFWRVAISDIVYHLAALTFSRSYPGYVRHSALHPLIEYVSWLKRCALMPVERRRTKAAIRRCNEGNRPVFVLPLQLSTDYQIREHSSYKDMPQAATCVISSFAAYAPSQALLAVKIHPLDCDRERWRHLIRQCAIQAGIEDRVIYLGTGKLEELLVKCAGCVTVNSTSGLSALRLGRPVKAIGRAVYDIPGLTHQGSLESFWCKPTEPEPKLVASFVRVLAAAYHIRGDYYSTLGLRESVAGTVDRIERSALANLINDRDPSDAIGQHDQLSSSADR